MYFETESGVALELMSGVDMDLEAESFYWPSRAQMNIVTQGGAPIVDKVNYVKCTYAIVDISTGKTIFSDTGKIRGRGNSTWDAPKKPYKVKLDHKLPIVGMPNSKDWALLANYFDVSRIRNAVVFWMSQFTGLKWAPRSRNVDVYLNGSYQGLYALTESVEVDTSRVDVEDLESTDLTPPNVTGGYIMEIDVRMEENAEIGWWSRTGIPIIFDTPDGDIPDQFNYIKAHMQAAEDALFAENFLEHGWHRYFDVDSWCDWYLLTELVSNNDSGFGASVKITKERGDDKLYLGPPWDYDLSFGVTAYIPHPVDRWWTRVGATWIARMLEDPAFVARLKERWLSFKANLDGADVIGHISVMEESVADAVADDLALWTGTSSAPSISSYLASRMSWINGQLALDSGHSDSTPPATPTGFHEVSHTSTSVNLAWDDAVSYPDGVIGYRVRKNGVIEKHTRFPYPEPLSVYNTTTISTLSPSTQYEFTLEARDATGNWSTPTNPISVTTSS